MDSLRRTIASTQCCWLYNSEWVLTSRRLVREASQVARTVAYCGVVKTKCLDYSFKHIFDLDFVLHLCLELIRTNSIRLLIEVMLRLTLGKYFPKLTDYLGLTGWVYRLFIGGQWVDPVEGGSIELVLPSYIQWLYFAYSSKG